MKEDIEKTEPMKEEEQAEKKPKPVWKKLKRIRNTVILIVVVAGLTVVGMKVYEWTRPNRETITYTASSILEKVMPISDLSTCKCVYNGVARVYADESNEKELYRVSYEAEVWAGIKMDQLQITADPETKKITITLPAVEITDISVDMGSLKYMFLDSESETEGVSREAYQACIADVTKESAVNEEILSRAEENAVNAIRAVLSPLAEDGGYELEIIP